MDVDVLVNFLILNGQKWISAQRNIHNPNSVPLSRTDIGTLQRFYRKVTIERVRVRHLPQIENPPFYEDLARVGISVLLNFSQMAAITFDDTILISDQYSHALPYMSLLFHEMVHVVQYGLLGVDEFSRQYVQGWARNGFIYDAIPLEREAYELQRRFEAPPDLAFSVEEIVQTRLGKLIV